MELVWSIALGVTLSAAAGFRAFLPLFVLGVMERYHLMAGHTLGQGFGWISGDTGMMVLSVATTVEVLADKFPAVDHALDSLMTFLRPLAGGVSVVAVLSPTDPTFAYVSALVLAGATTLPIHLGKSLLRLGSNAVSGGTAAPALSALEDLSAGAAVVLAALLPVFAVLFAILGVWLSLRLWRRWRSRKARSLA